MEASTPWIWLPPTGATGDVFFSIIWSLWIARNKRIFESRHSSPQEVITRALTSSKEWTLAQIDSKPPSPQTTITTLHPRPSLPPNTILCNTDAAWEASTKASGLGWIFTIPGARSQQGFQSNLHVRSALQAEALAIREALKHAIHLGYTKIWLRSDSKGLIEAIVSITKPKEVYGILADIETLSSTFLFCSFSFVSRSLNGPADAIAKSALCNLNSSWA
ncbi:uncharacterized protein LOC108847814 [Raphanus sativus]|uniref:Uncharacterized protein LOC108847814 n=1 Tax=Raphanus sativus TaxID=3726 RepID=A0A6J0MXX4_RAPSA|nr:uncharacterized protein LOC108847814 [Raphanus sativus]